ncbi:hypothetical protein BLNAU_13669 [Blattamonas nauphoetae]|uniref:Uncharacterized protein n=1 Tax=Blattamonas nauphoetae TaxID=2049346 RepID=A0ABQ9XIU6_9EUKA|nr:hypothetical protein BLNAU_13669 [Blattamonas nauphoetae]
MTLFMTWAHDRTFKALHNAIHTGVLRTIRVSCSITLKHHLPIKTPISAPTLIVQLHRVIFICKTSHGSTQGTRKTSALTPHFNTAHMQKLI